MTGRAARPRRRKPLAWYNTDDGGQLPDCLACVELLFRPMFIEAVYSVSIERPGDPADLARRTVDAYHQDGHREV